MFYGPSGIPLACFSALRSLLWWDSLAHGTIEKAKAAGSIPPAVSNRPRQIASSFPLRHRPSSFGIHKKMSISCLPRQSESYILSRWPTSFIGTCLRPQDHRRQTGKELLGCLGRPSLFTIPAIAAACGSASPIPEPGAEYFYPLIFLARLCDLRYLCYLRATLHLFRCGSEPEVARSVGHSQSVRLKRPAGLPVDLADGTLLLRVPALPNDLQTATCCYRFPSLRAASLGIELEPKLAPAPIEQQIPSETRFVLCEGPDRFDSIRAGHSSKKTAQEIWDTLGIVH